MGGRILHAGSYESLVDCVLMVCVGRPFLVGEAFKDVKELAW